MIPVKNCLKQLSLAAALAGAAMPALAADLNTFTIEAGTSESRPAITVKAAEGETWNAFYYKLNRGDSELMTSSTQKATTEPLVFNLAEVDSDTPMEMALTTGTEPSESDFRWRSLARPAGKQLINYKGKQELLPPDDFDQYWEEAKKELDAVQSNIRVTREPDQDTTTGLLFKVELDSVQNTTIVGWFFVPREAYKNGNPEAEVVKKYPAIIITPGYGGTEPPIDRTKDGYITFSTNPRNHGPSKAYWKSPVEHLIYNIYEPENYYYKLASLDCLQAARFVLSRDEVQVDRVATEGGSQGGYFAIATAMLEPRIRCVAANVVAFTDYPDGMDLATAGHQTKFREILKEDNTTSALAAKSLAYTDGVNLITRVKAPVQINMGGVDPVCNYVCGIVAYNRLPEGVEKEFHIFPKTAHAVPGDMRAVNREWYDRWLKSDEAARD